MTEPWVREERKIGKRENCRGMKNRSGSKEMRNCIMADDNKRFDSDSRRFAFDLIEE